MIYYYYIIIYIFIIIKYEFFTISECNNTKGIAVLIIYIYILLIPFEIIIYI